ncbi:MAG: DUF3097 family protein [Ilumatobacteraceae bacterium]
MYERDILQDFDPRRKPTFPTVEAVTGLVVEDRASGFCGDVVRTSHEAVTLRARGGEHRHFRWKEGGFLFEGKPVTLSGRHLPLAPADHRLGSIATATPAAVSLGPPRIWVEGKHDAELVEHVWGDDLRDLGIVVDRSTGSDDLAEAVTGVRPGTHPPPGVLVDHLVDGSKCGSRRRSRPRRAGDRAPVRRRVAGDPPQGRRDQRLAGGSSRESHGNKASAARSACRSAGSGPACAARSRATPTSNRRSSAPSSN